MLICKGDGHGPNRIEASGSQVAGPFVPTLGAPGNARGRGVLARSSRLVTSSLLRACSLSLLAIGGVLAISGCNAITGLSDFTVRSTDGAAGAGGSQGTGGSAGGAASDVDGSADAAPPECLTNEECTRRATLTNPAPGGAVVPAVCLQPEAKCVELLSEDCTTITGEYLDDTSILIGSLFAITGSTMATNQQRQQGATLAIEEVNAKGGIPAPGGGATGRPLVMLSCDTGANMLRAGAHLVTDLHVPAIVGPNTSQDTIDLTTKLSAQGGTVLVSPSAVASSIVDLNDHDLTWLMVPTDVQRSPLMIDQVNQLEARVHTDRSVSTVKLSIIYRNDALGIGTRVSLDTLIINGKPIADPINIGAGGLVRIEPYDPAAADQTAIVTRQVAFAPDIIVLAGTQEGVDKVLVPLETAWNANNYPNRPYYILIDSNKVASLLTAATANNGLRLRIRGTGITAGAASVATANAFNVDFLARYGSTPTASSVGPSYDASYAIAYALAAAGDAPLTGVNVAAGLRKLTGGPTAIETGSQKVLLAFQHLSAGENINARGTFGPLAWDANGAIKGGAIEIWCIGAPNGPAIFQASSLSYDIETGTKTGTYTQCGPTQ